MPDEPWRAPMSELQERTSLVRVRFWAQKGLLSSALWIAVEKAQSSPIRSRTEVLKQCVHLPHWFAGLLLVGVPSPFRVTGLWPRWSSGLSPPSGVPPLALGLRVFAVRESAAFAPSLPLELSVNQFQILRLRLAASLTIC